MYRCCLCGKTYEEEQDAVKCVNKCGREALSTGKFIKKDVPQLPDVTNVEFDCDAAITALHSFDASLLFEQMMLRVHQFLRSRHYNILLIRIGSSFQIKTVLSV